MLEIFKTFKILANRSIPTLLVTLVIILVVRMLGIIPPIVVGKAIDKLDQGYSNETIIILVSLVGFALANALIVPLQAKHLTKLVQDIVREASVKWTRRILRKEFVFFQDMNIGSLSNVTERGIEAYERFIIFSVNRFLLNIIELVLISVYLIYIAGAQIIGVLILAAFLLIYLSFKAIIWRRPYIDEVNDTEDDLAEKFAETLQAGKSIKLFGAWDSALSLLNLSYAIYAKSSVKLAFASATLISLQKLISTLATVFTLLIGLLLLQSGNNTMSIGDFVVIFTFSGLFMNNIIQLTDAYKEVDQYKADKLRFDRVLSLPDFRTGDTVDETDGLTISLNPFVIAENGEILLESKLQIHIPAGSNVAIVGPTGSGKTTLINLLSGVYKKENAVEIGGIDISNLSEPLLTNIIHYAIQKTEFLSGAFDRSVLFGKQQNGDQNEQQHLASLGLQYFGKYVDNDLEFPVTKISGGEAKRLGIFRAFVSGAPIIMLDEPVESLDRNVARKVWKALFKMYSTRTLICVTHDEEFLGNFDIIINVTNKTVQVSEPKTPVSN